MIRIEQIKEILTEADYSVALAVDHDSASIDFGEDERSRKRQLEICIIDSSPLGDSSEVIDFITFVVLMPFAHSNQQADTLSKALHMINRQLVLGSFQISAKDEIYFKYVLVHPHQEEINARLLQNLVALIKFQQEQFGDYIEGICDGELSIYGLPDLIEKTMFDTY